MEYRLEIRSTGSFGINKLAIEWYGGGFMSSFDDGAVRYCHPLEFIKKLPDELKEDSLVEYYKSKHLIVTNGSAFIIYKNDRWCWL